MAIKFSQFNLRTDHTSGMYLVGYDGNQNIHITVDNLFDDFINGTENTIAMFGTDGTVLADSILSQDAGATLLTVAGQLNVDAAATFDTSITVTGDSTLNGNVTLGDASTDLITQTGTLYLNGPVKDTTDTLGAVDQILVSDATGELTFRDLADFHVGNAEAVEVPVKNVQGSALVKGDPVYISGSFGASGKLEVQLADASNALKMPAVGLLKQDLANNAQGFAVVTGKLRNLITDPIDGVTPTENDVIYVKPSGISGAALTTTKPVYGNFIQNIGKVGRVSTSNDGNLVVSSILRTNDIPNLTPGRLWIGSTGNTIESQTLFVDEANTRLGINEISPNYSLDIDGTLHTSGWAYFATSGPTSVAQLGGASTTTSQFNISSAATGGSFIAATNTLTLKANNLDAIEIDNTGAVQFNKYGTGAFTGTVAKNLAVDSSGNVIETDHSNVEGTGTPNTIPLWTDSQVIGNSNITQTTGGSIVMSGVLNMSNNKITNLTNPTNAQDAATKAYVDASGGGGGSIVEGTPNEIDVSVLANTYTVSLPGEIHTNLKGNVDGNVTGDLTGNVTGNLSGNTTGHRVIVTAPPIGVIPPIQNARISIQTDASTGIAFNNINAGAGAEAIAFENGGVQVGNIVVSGSTTSYNTSSDYRLKENVQEMTGAIERISKLEPKRFNFIENPDVTLDGFLAHEVQDIIPEAVNGEKDGTQELEEFELDENGQVIEDPIIVTKPKYQSIDQSKLVPLLVGAVKELIAEVNELKSKL